MTPEERLEARAIQFSQDLHDLPLPERWAIAHAQDSKEHASLREALDNLRVTINFILEMEK